MKLEITKEQLDALKEVLACSESYTDCGPADEGWSSLEKEAAERIVSSLIRELEAQK